MADRRGVVQPKWGCTEALAKELGATRSTGPGAIVDYDGDAENTEKGKCARGKEKFDWVVFSP
jgi:hypothetical protein